MADAKKQKQVKKYVPKRYCLKCGSGTSLAEHANRRSCGKCGYMEMK